MSVLGGRGSRRSLLAAVALAAAACGSSGGDTEAGSGPPTTAAESPAEAEPGRALADVRAAAEAVRSAGTGRFELALEMRGMPGVPDGNLGTRYGTYDAAAERLELRWVLSPGALASLGRQGGVPLDLPEGSRENPHVVSLWSKTGGLLVRVPSQDPQKWLKLADADLEAGAAQFGINLADATAAAGPPLIAALLDTAGPAAPAPAREQDPPDARRYSIQLDGGSGLDLLISSTLLGVLQSIDEAGQKKLFGMRMPTDVVLVDGLVASVDVDLKALFLELLRLAAPGAKEDPDEIDAFGLEAHARFSDAGAAVDLPNPGPAEIIPADEARTTRQE